VARHATHSIQRIQVVMAVFPQGFDATLAGHLQTEELVERYSYFAAQKSAAIKGEEAWR
jgi:hypothetical protein